MSNILNTLFLIITYISLFLIHSKNHYKSCTCKFFTSSQLDHANINRLRKEHARSYSQYMNARIFFSRAQRVNSPNISSRVCKKGSLYEKEKKTAPNAADVCFVTILRSTTGLSTGQYSCEGVIYASRVSRDTRVHAGKSMRGVFTIRTPRAL